jgi:hypothetical protein
MSGQKIQTWRALLGAVQQKTRQEMPDCGPIDVVVAQVGCNIEPHIRPPRTETNNLFIITPSFQKQPQVERTVS